MGATLSFITGCGCIPQGRVGIVETFGEYSRRIEPGCFCIVPIIQQVRHVYNLRQRQILIEIASKTRDNVFCTVNVAVFYRLQLDVINLYAYNVLDLKGMAESIVQDQIRSTLCKLTLDEAYETKEELTDGIKAALTKQLGHYGVTFIAVIIKDIDPDDKVKKAMNEINKQARLRVAAESEAEARKIQSIKQAEAEAEAKKLSGIGLAEQRRAIVEGLSSSISNFVENVGNVNPEQVMHLIMMNQYFDTLKDLGVHSHNNTIFLPHNPTSVNDLYNQLENSAVQTSSSSFKTKHHDTLISAKPLIPLHKNTNSHEEELEKNEFKKID